MEYVNGVLVYDEIRGVKIITLSRLAEHLFPNKKSYEINYVDELLPAVREWRKQNNADYYADVKEDFSIFDGARQAQSKGLSVVVVENLS